MPILRSSSICSMMKTSIQMPNRKTLRTKFLPTPVTNHERIRPFTRTCPRRIYLVTRNSEVWSSFISLPIFRSTLYHAPEIIRILVFRSTITRAWSRIRSPTITTSCSSATWSRDSKSSKSATRCRHTKSFRPCAARSHFTLFFAFTTLLNILRNRESPTLLFWELR